MQNKKIVNKQRRQRMLVLKNLRNRNFVSGFYTSKEWLEIRYNFLKISEKRCNLCGSTSMQSTLHVDHIKPRSLYPDLELDITNLQILCEQCNIGKSNTDESDWRSKKIGPKDLPNF